MKDKVLLFGASSFIGRHFLKSVKSFKMTGTYHRFPITNGIKFNAISDRLTDKIDNLSVFSKAIIFLADTHPDSCAKDKKKSYLLNVVSIKRIIDQLVESKVIPVFTSTEFVFSGKKGDYTEDDLPDPILTYGKQKLEIENYLKERCKDYLIVRFAKVYGDDIEDGTLFTNWIKKIKNHEAIYIATDQIFSPIYIEDVIKAMVELIKQKKYGLYHLAGPISYNRFDLLKMLIEEMGKYINIEPEIYPCSINDFPLVEHRPLNVSMKPDKLIKTIGIKLHPAEKMCSRIVKKYYSKKIKKEPLMVNLGNLKVKEDKKAKTPAFFCVDDNIILTQQVIDELIDESRKRGNCDIRLCLHKSSGELFHQMIIVHYCGKYRRPHKHLDKEEAYHIISGKMAIVLFSNDGLVKDFVVLDESDSFVYRIGKDEWHMALPLSEMVVFHEVKKGPFSRGKENIFAPWAPKGNDKRENKLYINELLKKYPQI